MKAGLIGTEGRLGSKAYQKWTSVSCSTFLLAPSNVKTKQNKRSGKNFPVHTCYYVCLLPVCGHVSLDVSQFSSLSPIIFQQLSCFLFKCVARFWTLNLLIPSTGLADANPGAFSPRSSSCQFATLPRMPASPTLARLLPPAQLASVTFPLFLVLSNLLLPNTSVFPTWKHILVRERVDTCKAT